MIAAQTESERHRSVPIYRTFQVTQEEPRRAAKDFERLLSKCSWLQNSHSQSSIIDRIDGESSSGITRNIFQISHLAWNTRSWTGARGRTGASLDLAGADAPAGRCCMSQRSDHPLVVIVCPPLRIGTVNRAAAIRHPRRPTARRRPLVAGLPQPWDLREVRRLDVVDHRQRDDLADEADHTALTGVSM